METGVIVRWGKLVPGREEKAIDLFAEATGYFGKLLAEKKVTYFEPFFFMTGDIENELGFFIFKGPDAYIFELLADEYFLMLQEKALYSVEHFQVDLLTVGEGISKQLERSAKVRVEYGIV
jgi:hypothetical protein